MDITYALRALRKNPGFAALAVAVIALGIGANTAVFSVVNAVLLRPLAYPEPERIVTLATLWKKSGGHGQVSAPDFRDWRAQSTAFSQMAYYQGYEIPVIVGSQAEYARFAVVSPEFFDIFRVQPALGRLFAAEEVKPGSSAAVVIGHSFWQARFGGASAALGSSVRLFGRSLTVVGVLPAYFAFPEKTDLWIPGNTIRPESTSRSGHNYRVVGRLKPGVSLEEAQSQMTAIGARLEQQYPPSNQGKRVVVSGLQDTMVKDVRLTLLVLLGAVGVVLLIACANIANLLLARATSRTREVAIRAAVGASRGRIVRQLFVESMLLASLGGAGGLALSYWGSRALVAMAPGNVPRLEQAGIDGWVLAFTFAAAMAASLLFGLAPALHASRVDLNEALKQGAARAVIGGRAGRLRGALVVAEIALSVMLLAGAGLLLKSFTALHNVALGFRTDNVLVMTASVQAGDLDGAHRAARFFKGLLAEVAAMPGVIAAGATRTPPSRVGSDGGYWIDRLPGPEGVSVSAPQAVFSVVAPGAFATLGIPLRRGRDFHDRDTYQAPFTAIINEALARKSFPGQDPVGRVIYCGFDLESLKGMTIVGVVGDVRQYGPSRAPLPEIYMPYEQHPFASTMMRVLVRTAGEPAALAEALRRKVREMSPDVPMRFTTMEATLSEVVAAPRFRAVLLSVFAGLAVVLAMAGVYGVMAYMVSRRANEIGLRMALGAGTGDVLRLVLRQGLTLAAIGVALGLAGAATASRLLTTLLFEVQPTDPATYAAVAALLALVTLAASYVPARRAAKLDPLVALRTE